MVEWLAERVEVESVPGAVGPVSSLVKPWHQPAGEVWGGRVESAG